MNKTTESIVLEGQPPEKTPQHIRALFAWADDATAKAPQVLNDGLRHAATLSVAIFGGTAALADKMASPLWCKVGAIAFLMLGLTAALWGAIPFEASMRVSDSRDIQEIRRRGLKRKLWALRLAALGIVFALLLLAFGLLRYGYKGPV